MTGPLGRILLTVLLALAMADAIAAKPAAALRCYKAREPVQCLLALAQEKLRLLADPEERADAVGELLYTLAIAGGRNDELLAEAEALSRGEAVRAVKRMDLLYAIDLYAHATSPPADDTYAIALERFARLDKELSADGRVELYFNACSIVSWHESLRERWMDFAESACSPRILMAMKPESAVSQALVMVMMPVAMTLAEDRRGFAMAAEEALSWLGNAEKRARNAKGPDREFVAFMGVLIHNLNALCLDAFELPDAADVEIERARQVLRRLESRVGISGRSTILRRLVVESMFETGRAAEAKKMLKQLLSRVDGDAKGKRIPLSEQVAILLLAARLEHGERSGRAGMCGPEDEVRI